MPRGSMRVQRDETDRSYLEQDRTEMQLVRTRSENLKHHDLRKLAPDRCGLGVLLPLLSVHLIQLTTASHEVHLIQADPLRLLEKLPEECKGDKDRQRDAAHRK